MCIFYTINEAHKQYSLLDTIFYYIFLLDLQENIYGKVKKTYYMSAGVDLGDLNIDIFLEVQDKKYS